MLLDEDLIQIRRHLHQIPELALKETQTAAYLKQIIAQLPQQYLTVQTISQLPTAILVHVQGTDPKRTLGYRADMDGLPLTEATNLSYQSKHAGVMHACGHDFHLTIALGILAYFAEHQPQDNLVFFFQPAEESDSGAVIAEQAGIFTGQFRPDEFYALHVNPDLKVGQVGCRQGTLFAGTTEVDVDFIGEGGHAAAPQKAHDAIVAAAEFVNQSQTIVARSIDPLDSGVVTFGQLNAGTIRNIIAGHAHLAGTIRGLDQPMIVKIGQRLDEIARGIAQSFGLQVKLELNQGGYLPVVNDPQLTKVFMDSCQSDPQIELVETKPAMTGEDFGYLLQHFPGVMFWLGVQSSASLHTARLQPNEAALAVGVRVGRKFLEQRMGQ